MPESATLEAPPAPAAAPAAPKPSPAARVPMKERSLFKSMESRSGRDNSVVTPPSDTPPPPPPEARPGAANPTDKVEDGPPATDPNAAPSPTEKADATPPAKSGEKAPKVNPWKERDRERARADAAETRLRDLEKNRLTDQERSTLSERIETLQKQNEDMANRLRFKDYESSPEFLEKYHKPYQDSLTRAMDDLQRIPITDASGQTRAATEQDLFEIVGLMQTNLPEAKRRANEVFGELAPEVMGMANDVRKTLSARNTALKAEQENGKSREQQQREAAERQQTQLLNGLKTLWEREHTGILNNPKDPGMKELISPIEVPEGKEATPEEREHNESLARGYDLVDKWWGKKVGQCKSQQEVEQLVKRHAAIRARAAGFGPLRIRYNRLVKKLADAEKKLAGYTESAPPLDGRSPATRAVAEDGFGSSFRKNMERRTR